MGANAKDHATVFLPEEDDETRRPLVRNLRRYGYRVVVAFDEEDALEKVSGHAPADLVLLNLVGKSTEEALDIGRRIRAHAKYDGPTPLVVMAERDGEDFGGTD